MRPGGIFRPLVILVFVLVAALVVAAAGGALCIFAVLLVLPVLLLLSLTASVPGTGVSRRPGILLRSRSPPLLLA